MFTLQQNKLQSMEFSDLYNRLGRFICVIKRRRLKRFFVIISPGMHVTRIFFVSPTKTKTLSFAYLLNPPP